MSASADRTSSIMDNEPTKGHDNAAQHDTQARSACGPRRITEILLGGLSVLAAAALLAIGGTAFAAPIGFRILSGLATAQGAAVLIYHAISATVFLAPKQKQRPRAGLPPAWSLSLNLVLGLGGVVVAALLVSSTAEVTRWQSAFDGAGDDGTATPVAGYVARGNYWFRMSIAGCALGVVLALIHLALSVFAAVDVHRVRRANRPVASRRSGAPPSEAAPAYSPRGEPTHEIDSNNSSSGRSGKYSPEPKSLGV